MYSYQIASHYGVFWHLFCAFFDRIYVFIKGLAVIAQAKNDGSWSLLDQIETLTIPDDFRQELAKYPHALTHFEEFPKSVRRSILLWIDTAKRPETRAKRVAEAAAQAANNIRANQWNG